MHLGNVGLVAALLSAVDEPRCFVHAGTCSEYARAEAGVLIPESHPMLPESLYGAAKAGAALFGAACARRRGLRFLWLRLFGVFGVGEASHRLVPHVIAHLRRGERPSLTGGTQERDLTYVDDVADALVLAAGSTSLDAYVPYNVCSGVPVTIRAVAEAVARKMGRPDSALGLGDLPYRSDEAMWVVGDPTRFRAATGWAPRVGLEEGIGRMIEADGIG
jgi:nucleoside-diphosphate-sugar epimerase